MTGEKFLNVKLASELLEQGHCYTRRQLRDEFSVPRSVVINDSFLPSGFSSVWIFLAEQGATVGLEFPCSIEENSFRLPDSLPTDVARLLAQHHSRGLELLVFLRKRVDSPSPVYDYRGTYMSSSEEAVRLVSVGSKVVVDEGQGRKPEPPQVDASGRSDQGHAIVPSAVYGMLERECALTGSKVDVVLVPTPIERMLPAKLDDGFNVLMLRRDVAELFTRNLIAIDPNSMTVRVCKALAQTEYSLLIDARVSCRSQSAPSRNALAAHLSKFVDG